jgi:predicted cobalt transporter CbtA
MLSDRERATWEQIQDQFLTEDAGFAQTFNAPADLPPDTRHRPIAAQVRRILLWCAGVLGLLLLFAGAVGGALLVAMLLVAMLMERR